MVQPRCHCATASPAVTFGEPQISEELVIYQIVRCKRATSMLEQSMSWLAPRPLLCSFRGGRAGSTFIPGLADHQGISRLVCTRGDRPLTDCRSLPPRLIVGLLHGPRQCRLRLHSPWAIPVRRAVLLGGQCAAGGPKPRAPDETFASNEIGHLALHHGRPAMARHERAAPSGFTPAAPGVKECDRSAL